MQINAQKKSISIENKYYMSVKERLKDFAHYKRLSDRAFCKEVGLSETYINSIRTSIQPDKVQLITVRFPDLNAGWLLTGEGDMLKSSPNFLKEESVIYEKTSKEDKIIEFLMNQNKSLEQIVHDQNEIMMKMQNRITSLEVELKETKNVSTAQGMGAGCAAVV